MKNKLRTFVFAFLFVIVAMSAAIADMPITKSEQPDKYLDGVRRIVVRVYTATDGEVEAFLLWGKIESPSSSLLAKHAAEELHSLLGEDIGKKITIEAIRHENTDLIKATDEDILHLDFYFKYSLRKYEGENIIVGTVEPKIWRIPPSKMREDRISGYHRLFTETVTANIFIPGKEYNLQESAKLASQESLKIVSFWINNLFSDLQVKK